MKRLLKLFREPIVLFFILGFLLFILYARTKDLTEQGHKQIFVAQDQIKELEETFTKTWNRVPDEDERSALVNDLIMDEIFYKEALAMGLDKTDLTVKKRLRQIIEMMMDDYAKIYPSEEQLRSYLSENQEKFRGESRFSFIQLHFPTEEKGQATQFLSRLQSKSATLEEYAGGLRMIPDWLEAETESNIEKIFGPYFTGELLEMETGNWEGPLASPYGWHLVQIRKKMEGELPELSDIWDQVEREWSEERKKEIKEEQYRILREHYTITVEEQ